MVEALTVTGIVQGVGFRPFVYRLATELGLHGAVGNDAAGVFITIAGDRVGLDEFARRLVTDAPRLSRVDHIERRPAEAPVTHAGFHIVPSRPAAGERTLVPPDTAVCADCVTELLDPDDRRHRHPFITCTNCGPRFTIIRSLPYDRPATTMAGFEMCPACAHEYSDPADRRYHAQPIGCHDCGPRLTSTLPGDPIDAMVASVRRGETVALKGLGGFHLICDARSDAAIERLRLRKHRPDKPFAVMVPDLDAARHVAHVDDSEAGLLESPARPIVLLRARSASPLSPLVAPGNPLIGVMLPYTPAHHLLFAAGVGPLVCTSGNRSGEPIVYRDADVESALGPLADAIVTHDRPIEVPCDDSVVRVVDDRLLPIRRARGYAPVPVPLRDGLRSVLAVGGEMKSTCCIASRDHAWVSQHIGEQGTLASIEAFESVVDQFTAMYDVEPEAVAIDAHPGYATSRWARRRYPDRIIEVQHHHAHIAAVMAEHQLDPAAQVLGMAFDGTGYGIDGTIWGGEVLLADATEFSRLAHLAPIALPGGDAAIANPYRVALAHLHAAGVPWSTDLAPVRSLADDGDDARRVLAHQLESGFSCVPTTSMGRLFDAIAALVGLRQRISFEAQAAIELEVAATSAGPIDRGYRFAISPPGDRDAATVADAAPIVRTIVADLRSDVPVAEIAAAFHTAVVELIAEMTLRFRDRADVVALSGGTFQNALLTKYVVDRLRREDVMPLTHRLVPPNDGGLALGQAFVATHSRAVPTEEV